MARYSERGIWNEIKDGATAPDFADIVSALDTKACFFTFVRSGLWADARTCVDACVTAGDLTSDQGNFVKGCLPV